METKNNIGRMKCAICGCNTWVRENKNGILYANCHNHHQTKLNGDDSMSAKNALKQGKSWNNGLIFIYPNERTENDGNNTGTTNGTTGTVAGSANFRRADGQHATPARIGTTGTVESDDSDTIGIGCM